MTEFLRLDLPLVMSGVPDDQDACVARLVSILQDRNGIERVHVTHGDEDSARDVGRHPEGVPQTKASLCLHYDPERIRWHR